MSAANLSWQGTGAVSVAELWYGRSLHLDVGLGPEGSLPARLWCNLDESVLAPGVHPLESACAGHFVEVEFPPGAAGNEDGGSDAGVLQDVTFPITGTVEILEVTKDVFDDGGRVRVRFEVPPQTVTSAQAQIAATLTIKELQVDATFDPLPDCPGGCDCGCRYGGWLPGGG